MNIFSSTVRDAPPVASASGRKSFFAGWRRARSVAIALAFLLVLAGLGLGLRWAGPWRWWSQTAPPANIDYHWEQAKEASDKGDLAIAKSHLEAILTLNPLNARAQFLMARTCRRDRDPSAAMHLSLAQSLGSPYQQILLEKRLEQAESGDTWSVEEALLDELNRLPPEERLILEALVKGYLNNFRFLDAVELATPWIERYPHDGLAYLYRARAYQGLGRWGDAIKDYREALKILPDSMTARLWCADSHLALHDFEEDLKQAFGQTSLYNESLGTVSTLYQYDRVQDRDAGVPKRAWD